MARLPGEQLVRLQLEDQDKDTIELVEVGGFGEPMLVLRVTQEGDESNVNMNIGMAKEMLKALDLFLKQSE